MNLFLPICRDLFINFEWFLFNWKLLQSPGSEPGLIWTWIALDPSKEENKKRQHSDYWRGCILSPLCPSQLLQPDPFTWELFSTSICWQSSPWDLLVGGIPTHCPRWGLTPQAESVFTDVPSGLGNLVRWRSLEGLALLCHSWPVAKCKACGSCEKYF